MRLNLPRHAARRLLLLTAMAMPATAPAALIDFSQFSDAERAAINGKQNTLEVGGLRVTAARNQFSPSLNIGAHTSLWIRNDTDDHGLGVCSSAAASAEACGGALLDPLAAGQGDHSELGNNFRDEVIRLERPENSRWSDFWVSSLDTLRGPGHEAGRFYWSEQAVPVLNALPYIRFNQTLLGWSAAQEEGSIFDFLISQGFDANAQFVFFRADVSNGFDNDYLVYKAGITAVPLPSSVMLMGPAAMAMGFRTRRRVKATSA